MTNETSIVAIEGKWVVYVTGAVYAETQHALALRQLGSADVIYIPRDDVAMAFFDKTDQSRDLPGLGTAEYYSIDTKSRVLDNVAWSIESPTEAAAQLRGYLAFDSAVVTVERQ
ncbi:DUF427 domain-containing protein [Pseudoruegeria sp. SK021]|uniref:DUF427 domain-containing protein n=1 Tax=Pseudoruegeria sp. SK021 TaxID=1933035 RepID=UPI000A234AD7|nr:DUF427 domain-containing protein [Pseudoruegeria sp. SK021]OSP56836.1 hypothetical protein BV911_00125 [Pseudoruegeria sp. SK021]